MFLLLMVVCVVLLCWLVCSSSVECVSWMCLCVVLGSVVGLLNGLSVVSLVLGMLVKL